MKYIAKSQRKRPLKVSLGLLTLPILVTSMLFLVFSGVTSGSEGSPGRA